MSLLRSTSATFLTALLAAVACSEQTPESPIAGEARPLILVSVEPYRWFVTQLAGDAADVVSLLPAGASPATFEPGMETLRSLDRASLLVRVGHPHFPFEQAWMNALLRDRPDLQVVDAHTPGNDLANEDPHEWLSPEAGAALVTALMPAIAALTGDAATVEARAASTQAEIQAIDRELRSILAPVRGGRFLVLHPAWGHFARHYGLEQVAIEREGKAPGPRELAEQIAEARRVGHKSVIVVPQIDPRKAAGIARAIGGRVIELDPLGADWPTTLRHTARVLADEAVLP